METSSTPSTRASSEYSIAIPSYKRVETLRKKTLPLLHRHGLLWKDLHIFVADKEEAKEYANGLYDQRLASKIVVARPGIRAVRNYMQSYFPEGRQVFYIDDDIAELHERKDEKTMAPVADLDALIREGFKVCRSAGASIFGFTSVPNPFYMQSHVSLDLRYVNACAYGMITTHDENTYIRVVEDQESVERTIRFYERDGKVVRFNYIAVESNWYTEPGGQQAEGRDRNVASTLALLKTWPQFCRLKPPKKNGKMEIRLHDYRGKRA